MDSPDDNHPGDGDTHTLTATIPKEVYTRLRIYCAKTGEMMKAAVSEALEQFLDDHGG